MKQLWIGAALLLFGFVLSGVSTAILSSEGAIGVGVLLGILALIGGVIVLVRSNWAVIGGGRVIEGGQTVEFRRAHEAFAAQASAAQQAAAQHYAAQQAAYAATYSPPQPGMYAAPDAAARAVPHPGYASPMPPIPVAADGPQPTPAAPTDVLSTPAAGPPHLDEA